MNKPLKIGDRVLATQFGENQKPESGTIYDENSGGYQVMLDFCFGKPNDGSQTSNGLRWITWFPYEYVKAE